MTVEADNPALAGLTDDTEDRARAQQVAAQRRRHKQLHNTRPQQTRAPREVA